MRWRILSIVGALYAAQFIPFFFAIFALPIILRSEGYSATQIGLVQLAGLPYLFKFLWAPMIDRFRLGRDRYKSWIVVLSGCHVVFILCLSLTDPGSNLAPLFVFLFLASLTVSTQDVAVDALVITILKPSERTMGATLQNTGAYVGGVIGGFAFLSLYSIVGWKAALIIQSILFVLPLTTLFMLKEPVRLRGTPAVTFRNALRFFSQAKIRPWLGILATMQLPLLMLMLPMRLMMVDQGMTTEEIALWFGLFALSAAGAATLFIGPLLRNLPRVRALYVVGLLNIPFIIVITSIAWVAPEYIRFAIIIAWVAVALTDIVVVRGAMDKVRPEMPGFDFSVQIAIYYLLSGFADPLIGRLIDLKGFLPAFLIAIPLTLVPLAVLWFTVAKFGSSKRGLDGDRAVSTGTIFFESPQQLITAAARHFAEEHGISHTWPEPNRVRMEEMGCIVEFKAMDASVDILIDTPNDNFLVFIREEVIEFLEGYAAEAVTDLRWTGGVKAGELPANFRIFRAVRRREIHAGLIRVTLEGIDTTEMQRDGIHIRLMMPLDRGRKPVWPVITENGGTSWPQGKDKLHSRFVTVRQIRPDDREIDVDIAHHAGGLISDWAAREGDDQEVGVMGPGGDVHLDHTQNVLLAADATGLPALARLIESVDGRVTGHLFAAAPSQQELENYLPRSSLRVVALNPETFSDEIENHVLSCKETSVGFGWFAGEFRSAQAIRTIFRDAFGLAQKAQLSVAYWKSGDPGHKSRAR